MRSSTVSPTGNIFFTEELPSASKTTRFFISPTIIKIELVPQFVKW